MENRIAEMIAGHVVVVSAIAEATAAVPSRRVIWRRAAITAPSPAGSLETRDRIAGGPHRGRSDSETYAKPSWAVTRINSSGVTLAVPVRAESGSQPARSQ